MTFRMTLSTRKNMFVFFDHVWPLVRFLTKISIFDQNFNFWLKFQFLIKKIEFSPKLQFKFLTKIIIFRLNLDFWPKFGFFAQISIFFQICFFRQNFDSHEFFRETVGFDFYSVKVPFISIFDQIVPIIPIFVIWIYLKLKKKKNVTTRRNIYNWRNRIYTDV